ncbi:histone deacetylase family protein [Larsenimonas rhizosphaerae]|uniref:Histone deacetylase family protein n=1 Tax=Larsenimonas rhizosphaerae TaxID=2944682 RepID=A0AA41ZKG4_9GAMM|nr:histone deacetylase family protein [Larsenimonas rhizosphaerae]MCX2523348.1 histone deacetylase family protein [Larsenimonas rhizosphaerae]
MITSFILPGQCRRHMIAPWHPDHPRRLDAIERQLALSGVARQLQHFDALPVAPDMLRLAHTPDYLALLADAADSDTPVALDEETLVNADNWDAARCAAGGVIKGVNQLFRNQADNVFCAVRPPGHHAEKAQGMGFCLINNVALAACYARRHYDIQRIAIIDIDAHQCNGTLDILAHDHDILICTLYQQGLYPWSSANENAPNVESLPLPAGSTGQQARDRCLHQWMPRIDAHRPELILISAGFDAHRDDPMTELAFDSGDYFDLTRDILAMAERHANGRVLSVLEGGYHLESLAPSVNAHLSAMIGLERP